jgi:hypothetical protein
MKTTTPAVGPQHHIFGSTRNPNPRIALFRLLGILIQDRDDLWRKQTDEQLRKVFKQWKAEHGSRTPLTHRGATGLGARIPITFKAAAPYECTDDASDYVSLCILLLRSKYPPLIALNEAEDITSLLAVAALMEPEMTQFDSLVLTIELYLGATVRRHARLEARNNGLLLLLDKLAPSQRKEVEKKNNLDSGRPKGAEVNRANAEKRKAEARQEAVSYFRAHTRANYDKCAEVVAKQLNRRKSTVLKAIAGSKAEALQQLEDQNNS